MSNARRSAKSHDVADRRRDARIAVGLPVDVHIAGRPGPVTVEMMDIARRGVRFRALAEQPRVGEHASFSLFAAEHGRCSAEGRVARVQPGGEFIVTIDRANRSFKEFVDALARDLPRS